jgi:hypothetical protein
VHALRHTEEELMRAVWMLILVPLLALAAVAAAHEPTLSDIVVCNQEAQAQTADSPNALPRPGGPREPERAADARSAPPGTKTDPSGSVITRTPEPLLMGMEAEKIDDPAYRAAYRSCMERRRRSGG